ncbi:class I SAM-dependent methyltransferase [Nitrospira moscoviensis]|uniref:Putative Methyltransferase n=1 Tax=Nitrospira moscoviensis TaxID=42253 RepID=A0A0K2GJ46_NITMO|nr:class I SAM-dependent methyltransferase [Nitrospira moscoviensis]ALA60956.1 putative Methyltransferase [Nitrospira moscoviensis]
MRLYAEHIFPRLMDWIMAGEEFRRLRGALLAEARGRVLELGVGTGLNLPHYPSAVQSLAAVDPAVLLPKRLAVRKATLTFPLRLERRTAESLPYDARVFDYVVSTWTLCTIPDPAAALREVHRVLKPTGWFLFLEHGRSDDPRIAAWQDRLNPIQRIIGCGCNLNRPIDRLITQAGLRLDRLDRFRMERVPRIGGEMYRGAAVPSA